MPFKSFLSSIYLSAAPPSLRRATLSPSRVYLRESDAVISSSSSVLARLRLEIFTASMSATRLHIPIYHLLNLRPSSSAHGSIISSSSVLARLPWRFVIIMAKARRNDVPELNDGWKFNENWFFNTLLLIEPKKANLNDVNVLNEACQRCASRMSARFGRRFSPSSIKTKLEHMRTIHWLFGKYLSTPGVTYDIENCDSTVTMEFWRTVNPEKENALFKHFRLNGNPFHIMHETIFEIEGVTEIPKDLTGSPGWPIHVRDSDDDELAVVLVGDCSKLKFPELFDEDNELVKPGKFDGGSSEGSGDCLFGDSIWKVD